LSVAGNGPTRISAGDVDRNAIRPRKGKAAGLFDDVIEAHDDRAFINFDRADARRIGLRQGGDGSKEQGGNGHRPILPRFARSRPLKILGQLVFPLFIMS
jgi:hypothetical protein